MLVREALHVAQKSRQAAGVGLQHAAIGRDIDAGLRFHIHQQHGFVHGGVTSYLADNALTFAGALALGPRVVTGEYKINYLRPAVRGTLLARAELIYAGRGHAICQCRIYVIDGEKETLVALAQGTINRVGDGPNASLPHHGEASGDESA